MSEQCDLLKVVLKFKHEVFILFIAFIYAVYLHIPIYPFITTITPFHLIPLFWFNFISCILLSIFYYNKLGLGGFFKVNAIGLLLFWISLFTGFNNFICLGNEYTVVFGEFNLISNSYPVSISLFIDKLSYSFAFLTTSIAIFVYFYTFCYFRYEPNVERLVTLLLLFVNSMILLVLSGNLVVLFLGWELIGVTSFFLINFWGARLNTLKSALKALVFNKVSDSFILASLVLLYNTFNTVDILVICNSVSFYSNCYVDLGLVDVRMLDLISFLLLIAAFIKSAQFGFHLWLPDSMEAPAPASALIHSATLVSAGIFLILRMAPLFELSILSSTLVPIIGAITAFYGGVVSSAQTDVKKILAYSTISHCGFMVLLSATFNLDLVLIYLYVHGFFKALLFLAAGSVMRFFRGQDFRYMGGAYRYLPVECIISIFGFWHLSGGPLSFGYAAKHYIITSLDGNTLFTTFIIINVLISILASIIYSSRFIYFVYFDFKKAKKPIYSEHCSALFFSKHFTLSSRAGALVLLCNYAFVIVVCTYLLTIWGPGKVISPVTYDIITNVSNPLASEITLAGPSIVNPVVIINYTAFIFFWSLMFIKFRKSMYFESDVYLIFLLIIVLSLLLFSLTLYPVLSYSCIEGIIRQVLTYLLDDHFGAYVRPAFSGPNVLRSHA